MSYYITKHGAEGKTVTRVFVENGKERHEVIAAPPKASMKRGLVSMQNGLVGGEDVKREQEAKDAANGVRDCVRWVEKGHGAYVADYPDVKSFDRWMHANERVNHNAGLGTPAPGDFRGRR